MRPLTPRQSEVLRFVRDFNRLNGWPPTRTEIARYFGWSSANAAEEHLQRLAGKGAIYLTPGIARGITVA